MAHITADHDKLWIGGRIPYTINHNFNTNQANEIRRILNSFALEVRNRNGYLLLTFVNLTSEDNYIWFNNNNRIEGSSKVGMQGGKQQVLAPIDSIQVLKHEICHALGFYHEHIRQDRDSFVTIFWGNIEEDKIHNNFDIPNHKDTDDIGPYDYDSLMHYHGTAFGINGMPTIESKPPGRRIGPNCRTETFGGLELNRCLSQGDVYAMKLLYPKRIYLSETSDFGPTLTTKDDFFTLMAWKGSGNNNINFIRSNNGYVWDILTKTTLKETTPYHLSVTTFKDSFWAAWTGEGAGNLNIISSRDGINWHPKITLPHTSEGAPALTTYKDKLYISWIGTPNKMINLLSSDNGITWSGLITIPETSKYGVSLSASYDRLLVAWTGEGQGFINILPFAIGSSFDYNLNKSKKITLSETSDSSPSIMFHIDRFYLAWRGSDDKLNILTSSNGQEWKDKYTALDTSRSNVSLVSINQPSPTLVWGWAGTNASNLNVMDIPDHLQPFGKKIKNKHVYISDESKYYTMTSVSDWKTTIESMCFVLPEKEYKYRVINQRVEYKLKTSTNGFNFPEYTWFILHNDEKINLNQSNSPVEFQTRVRYYTGDNKKKLKYKEQFVKINFLIENNSINIWSDPENNNFSIFILVEAKELTPPEDFGYVDTDSKGLTFDSLKIEWYEDEEYKRDKKACAHAMGVIKEKGIRIPKKSIKLPPWNLIIEHDFNLINMYREEDSVLANRVANLVARKYGINVRVERIRYFIKNVISRISQKTISIFKIRPKKNSN